MNTRTKRFTATGISLGAVAAVVAGVYAFGASAPAADPAPTPTVVREWIPATEPAVDADQLETDAATERARVAAEAEAARVAAEQAAATQAAADAAAAQAAADEAARASQTQQKQSTGGGGAVQAPAAPAAPAAPVRCPAGSSANSNDGVNDTSCYPDICFSIAVPNPDHPECDAPFRP